MNIIVVGSGAMGCLFGGWLGKIPGNEVLLVDTWQEHVNALHNQGLKIESERGKELIKVQAALPDQVDFTADLIILFTKSYATDSSLKAVNQVIKSDTIVLTLQNGLGNIEKISAFVPIEQIIVGTTTFNSRISGPAYIQSEGSGHTWIQSADSVVREQTTAIAEMLDQAGFHCQVSDQIFVTIWEKLAFNSALNTMCTVTRLPVGGIGRTQEGKELAMQIAEEVIAVANRKGIAASLQRCKDNIAMALEHHKNHKPSMLQDILSDRITEIDAMNAAVVREAEALKMEVPATRVMAMLVNIIQADVMARQKGSS